jgi:hypothetical protein
MMKVASALMLISLLPMTAFATGDPQRSGKRQGPPPEAIEACANKKAGDSVEFTGRRGETLKATCQERNGQMAAVPEGKRQGGERPE